MKGLSFILYGSDSEMRRAITIMNDNFNQFITITKLDRNDFVKGFGSPLSMDFDISGRGCVSIRNATDLLLFWFMAQLPKELPISYCTSNFDVFSSYTSWDDFANVIEVENLDGIEQAYIIAKKLGLVVNYKDFVNNDEVSAIF